jgi:hypothetical protein
MEEPQQLSNIEKSRKIDSYDELRHVHVNEKQIEIGRILDELEKYKLLYETTEADNENFRVEKEFYHQEIEKLKQENLALTAKLNRIKESKKSKGQIIPDENKLKIFIDFYEDSLRSEKIKISHFYLRQKIEKLIKNASDREVLYFILQQTLMYKRGMVILTEAQIKDGVKSGTKTWTEGVEFSRNTISASLARLTAHKYILRYKKNQHKSVFFINVAKSREIYAKLEKGEIIFDDVIYYIDVDMIKNKKQFLALSIKRTGSEQLSLVTLPPTDKFQDTKCTEPVQLENSETGVNTGSEAGQDCPINNGINSKLNDKQTGREDCQPDVNFDEQNLNQAEPEKEQPSCIIKNIEKVFKLWKIDNQFTISITGNESPEYNDYIRALRTKVQIYAEEFIVKTANVKLSVELAERKERLYNRLCETVELININVSHSSIEGLVYSFLNYIDQFLEAE